MSDYLWEAFDKLESKLRIPIDRNIQVNLDFDLWEALEIEMANEFGRRYGDNLLIALGQTEVKHA